MTDANVAFYCLAIGGVVDELEASVFVAVEGGESQTRHVYDGETDGGDGARGGVGGGRVPDFETLGVCIGNDAFGGDEIDFVQFYTSVHFN